MPLYVRGSDIASARVETYGGHMETRMVYGKEASLMVATRPAGYHSRPHIHDCEQMNYVVDGEIWVFVEDKYFLVKAGDFYRVPAMAVHWGWNRSDKPVTIVEVHAPPLDHTHYPHVVALLEDGEHMEPGKLKRNIRVSDEYAEIEKKLLAELGEEEQTQ